MPPSIFSKFKKSPSQPTKIELDHDDNASSPNRSAKRPVSPYRPHSDFVDSPTAHRARDSSTPSTLQTNGTGGSHFIEEFDEQGVTTPDTRPRGFTLPPLGTPKLTIQEDGASSPVSFGSSPHSQNRSGHFDIRRKPSQERIGLGVGTVDESNEYETIARPVTPSPHPHTMAAPADAASVNSAPILTNGRDRSGSTISNNDLRPIKSSTTFGKPTTQSLKPPDGNGKKSKKSRRMSASSKNGIAAALAKGGLALAHGHTHTPDGEPILGVGSMKSAPSSRRGSRRNPYLKSSHRPDGDAGSDALEFDDDEEDEDEDDHSEYETGLPVTGFAVASNRRNAEFHSMFPSVDEGDYLIEDYGCALSKDILVQGRLYVSENHVCFHANIFGWITDIVLPFTEIKTIEKKMTALVIPNAISISTPNKHYTFASFISRDTTFDVMMNIWRLCNPNAIMSATSADRVRSRAPSDAGDANAVVVGGGKGHAKTECACGKEGKHFTETALSTTFPSTPEKVYNLMFNSGWLKEFMSEDQKLKDVESSDWKPSEETKILSRGTSYIKPLNGSIGPKQTKCHIVDEQIHCDYDDYIVMLTTTKTPDVPSGGVFSVKTKTCLTWAGGSSTKVLVTTQVDWTGKSWVKGIIDKSAIEGQKQYHNDLDKGMRAHMKAHPTEFFPEGTSSEDAEAADEAENLKLSDAEKYAAQTRKNRQNQDYSALQGALDSVLSGFKAIFGGVGTAIESISDLLNLGDEGSKVVFLGILVLILVGSNIYTYIAWRPSSESMELRRYKRSGGLLEDGDLSETVRMLLRNAGHGSSHGRERGNISPRGEAEDLARILDQVAERTAALRDALKSSIASDEHSSSPELD